MEEDCGRSSRIVLYVLELVDESEVIDDLVPYRAVGVRALDEERAPFVHLRVDHPRPPLSTLVAGERQLCASPRHWELHLVVLEPTFRIRRRRRRRTGRLLLIPNTLDSGQRSASHEPLRSARTVVGEREHRATATRGDVVPGR